MKLDSKAFLALFCAASTVTANDLAVTWNTTTNKGQLYTIDDKNVATKFLTEMTNLKYITKDPKTGLIYGMGDNPNVIYQICENSIKQISTGPSNPNNLFECPSAGPEGLVVLNFTPVGAEYGKIDPCTGAYIKLGDLDPKINSKGTIAFAQDDKGTLHLIDVDGKIWIKTLSGQWTMSINFSFPANHQVHCGAYNTNSIVGGGATHTGILIVSKLIEGKAYPVSINGIPWIDGIALNTTTAQTCLPCGQAPTAPTPTVPTPTVPTPTARGKKASSPTSKGGKSPTSKGGKKSYSANGSMMTGLMNTTQFNATIGYFNM